MQLQSINQQLPNSIPISKIRQDIDALTDLLAVYPVVNVLRGQKILFKAVDPVFEERGNKKIRTAAVKIREFSKNYQSKKRTVSGSKWIINEREKIRKPAYYD